MGYVVIAAQNDIESFFNEFITQREYGGTVIEFITQTGAGILTVRKVRAYDDGCAEKGGDRAAFAVEFIYAHKDDIVGFFFV